MKIIGITGGIGSGKTAILSHLKEKYSCEIILADEVAHLVKEPGQPCYDALVKLVGKDILTEDGQIDRGKMAERIFADEELLRETDRIIHPAVKAYILSAVRKAEEETRPDFLFIEAALLIEEGYADIVDELWYIYADERIRKERLRKSRSYSDAKIESILSKQLSEKEYRKQCRFTIDNSGDLSDTYEQIDKKLEEYL